MINDDKFKLMCFLHNVIDFKYCVYENNTSRKCDSDGDDVLLSLYDQKLDLSNHKKESLI